MRIKVYNRISSEPVGQWVSGSVATVLLSYWLTVLLTHCLLSHCPTGSPSY